MRKTDIFMATSKLLSMKHPNILLFHGIHLDDQYLSKVTLFMSNGTVYEQLHVKGQLTIQNMTQILELLESVAVGVSFLHAHKQMHGNLNTSSIYIDEDWNFKISDFGQHQIEEIFERVQRIQHPRESPSDDEDTSIPYWVAPEILRGVRSQVGPSSDAYSFGILIWELMHGRIPYQTMQFKDFVEQVGHINTHRLPIETKTPSKGLTALMTQCLNRDEQNRPQFEVIIETLKQLRAKATSKQKELAHPIKRKGVSKLSRSSSHLSNHDAIHQR
eukprot:GABU01005193.1.p1 GENE.GABU01005193.1~~GABU01005193.1.p1  ORF type:complete len:274 (+),score=52.58 GABU01005193.1:552-1373(+)